MMIRTVAMAIFMVGIFVFGMSYHNIDLSVNMQYGAIDINGFGFTQDKLTMYLNGMTGLNISIIMMISAFAGLFGIKDNVKKWRGTV